MAIQDHKKTGAHPIRYSKSERETRAPVEAGSSTSNTTASEEVEIEDAALVQMPADGDPLFSINVMLKKVPPQSQEDPSIFRVPPKLRKVDEEAYTPKILSIGPFHHGKPHLNAMEEYKLKFLRNFLNRRSQSLEVYFKMVREWEQRARDCYAETIHLISQEFVQMILLDACFIVELLLRDNEEGLVFDQPWMLDYVTLDIVLLENQLPFFIIEDFFKTATGERESGQFLNSVFRYFKQNLKMEEFCGNISSGEIKHIADFIHRCYVPSPFSLQLPKGGHYQCPPSITMLQMAGVKFRKASTSASLFDIKFTNGILEIPQLNFDDSTVTWFRNLIALEQCQRENHGTERCIIMSEYFGLLDGMINTTNDVDLLIQEDIIPMMLGSSEEISKLFNNIGKEVFICFSNFSFAGICQEMNAYCKSPWHKWQAILRRDYFNSPWAIISLIAALVLLVLTIIQTICSIRSL